MLISQISCSFAQSAFVTECVGRLYSFECNEDGQLGSGHDENIFTPTQVSFHDGQVDSIVHVDYGLRRFKETEIVRLLKYMRCPLRLHSNNIIFS